MVRGYDQKIFYCETNGTTETIVELEFNSKSKNEIHKEEIWQLNGGHIVAFELDNECILNDNLEHIKQSLYVMDNKTRIYLLQNTDNDRYTVTKTFNLSQHSEIKDDTTIRDNDWNRLHMTKRTLTFGK